ncbi:sugar ABC transporter substrate-binding protein [Actinokineospora diospyrosa]|uniref:Ribose transport system substrate-binding protein n=1 Tax=Actinokineospora diospyrosa TaxID=103728 RepID=A0ABT1IBD9_9PSEU|nr:substrate-binding domain-containing protein [Actinokineospora diospyrosa]MCP2269952.1 ribose transport system substrate-binding protein [Actinokineospora diospyrosa]
MTGAPRRAFLVVSALRGKSWLWTLVGHLHDVLDRDGTDLVFKAPHRDYDVLGTRRLLRGITHRGDDRCGFIMVTDPARLEPALHEFSADLDGPVVYLDVEPFTREDDYPPRTGFVGYSAREICQTAGRWLARTLPHPEPSVHVVASREHRGRQDGFVEALRSARPAARLSLDDTCAFTRALAQDSVRARLRAGPLDAVFCTNDDMALGAVDALRWANHDHTTVTGVDGAADALALIDAADSPLRATVVQDSYAIAEAAVDLMHRLLDGRPARTRTYLEPFIHLNRTRESTPA